MHMALFHIYICKHMTLQLCNILCGSVANNGNRFLLFYVRKFNRNSYFILVPSSLKGVNMHNEGVNIDYFNLHNVLYECTILSLQKLKLWVAMYFC